MFIGSCQVDCLCGRVPPIELSLHNPVGVTLVHQLKMPLFLQSSEQERKIATEGHIHLISSFRRLREHADVTPFGEAEDLVAVICIEGLAEWLLELPLWRRAD